MLDRSQTPALTHWTGIRSPGSKVDLRRANRLETIQILLVMQTANNTFLFRLSLTGSAHPWNLIIEWCYYMGFQPFHGPPYSFGYGRDSICNMYMSDCPRFYASWPIRYGRGLQACSVRYLQELGLYNLFKSIIIKPNFFHSQSLRLHDDEDLRHLHIQQIRTMAHYNI